MQYTTLDEKKNGADDLTNGSSNQQQASLRQSVPKHLSEPLTTSSTSQAAVDFDENDPFHVFREDLYRKLELVDESLTHYLRVVHQTDTAVNTHELKNVKKQLKRHMKNAESTLRDVQTTVDVVSNDRSKFAHISNSELFDRKSLVETSQDRLVSVKNEINSQAVKQKLLQDERDKTQRRMNMEPQDNTENSSFIADSHAKASLLMQQQDETLDDLDEAVTRVGDMAQDIHVEIGQQTKMLEEMEDDLQDAEEKLGLVMGKLAKMLKTKDKCQLGTILLLSLTVLVLFFLVLYT